MSDSKQTSTQQWVKQLGSVQLPVLSGVMQELNAVTQSQESSAEQLSAIILKDSSLTSKVLRIANSAYHRPNANNAITTISRAVVQLGFQGIKAISLSVMLVDSLLKEDAKERMLEWMGRGFHTAIQAENLLKQAGKSEKEEEVFITSLLLHVGEMAFWTSRSKTNAQLDKNLPKSSTGDAAIEQDLLGCTMKDITKALAEQWQLGSQVQAALTPGHNPSKATEAVLLGEEISFATEKGWESQEFKDALVKASLFSGLGLLDVRKLIEAGAEQASGVAVSYGAKQASNYIPSPKQKAKVDKPATMQSDPQLQLDILREMGAMVENNIDINTLFQMVVKGMHKGVGLERVSICLIDPKVTTMTAKYVLGEGVEPWRVDMKFPVKSEQDNLFAYCLHSRKNIWLKPKEDHYFGHLINKKMNRLLDVDNCMLSSVYAGTRPIGLIIVDRGHKGAAITAEQSESFEHFSQQTNASLAMLAANR